MKKPISIQKPEYIENKQWENYSILSAIVEKSQLNMEVSYTGCGNEEVYMTWSGNLMKSLPPKASLTSGVIQSENKCDKNIKRYVSFDITPLLEKTRKSGLVLLVDGFEKPIHIPAEKE